jgi:hypothetical protein
LEAKWNGHTDRFLDEVFFFSFLKEKRGEALSYFTGSEASTSCAGHDISGSQLFSRIKSSRCAGLPVNQTNHG